jgi:acetylornithine deacetylase/succinyl-diaminopimelate desuccinylase-like protein
MLDFGVRGDVNMSLTVYGPKRPLHSGHYGNWAPNPCLALAKLLAGMKDDQGRVTVKGYYDDVIPYTDAEKKAFAAMPSVEEQMKRELGIKRTEGDRTLADAYEWPTLNINGMKCAYAGEKATNNITTEATASLDLRQVPGTDHRVQVERVKQHIRDQGYHLIDRAPTDAERMQYEKIARVSAVTGGYNAQRTPLDLPVSQRVIRAVQASTDKPIVVMPTSGGSLPLFIFEKILAAKVITLCVANHDNNQHSEKENLRLQKLRQGPNQGIEKGRGREAFQLAAAPARSAPHHLKASLRHRQQGEGALGPQALPRLQRARSEAPQRRRRKP